MRATAILTNTGAYVSHVSEQPISYGAMWWKPAAVFASSMLGLNNDLGLEPALSSSTLASCPNPTVVEFNRMATFVCPVYIPQRLATPICNALHVCIVCRWDGTGSREEFYSGSLLQCSIAAAALNHQFRDHQGGRNGQNGIGELLALACNAEAMSSRNSRTYTAPTSGRASVPKIASESARVDQDIAERRSRKQVDECIKRLCRYPDISRVRSVRTTTQR